MRLFVLFNTLIISLTAHAEINSFAQAKTALKKYVYYDTMDAGDFYCGCKWEWKGATGARVTNSAPKQPDQAVMSVKGNINSKIYHLPHCGSYNKMAERNARYFNSEEEATRAGFRKARNCE